MAKESELKFFLSGSAHRDPLDLYDLPYALGKKHKNEDADMNINHYDVNNFSMKVRQDLRKCAWKYFRK